MITQIDDQHSVTQYTIPMLERRTGEWKDEIVWVFRCKLSGGKVHQYKKDEFSFCPHCGSPIKKLDYNFRGRF
ncbi:hypothetical protein [Nitrosopumilus sp.]|uniref:hypothetical protein n=1 Tax=Nitrosopumilus sp. TaxID=2024843 RepID=UPI003D11BC70